MKSDISKDVIRQIFLDNGFTIKEGCEDLKQYVYDAAYELLASSDNLSKSDPVAQEATVIVQDTDSFRQVHSQAEGVLKSLYTAAIEFNKRFESMNEMKYLPKDRISVPVGEWQEIYNYLAILAELSNQMGRMVKVVDCEDNEVLPREVGRVSTSSHPKEATEQDMAVYEAIAENYHRSISPNTATLESWMNNLKGLIGEYFDLGVTEGREGRDHDTADGDAGKAWVSICRVIDNFPKSHSDDSTHRREPVRTTESDKSDSNRTNITVAIKGPGGVISWPAWIIENALSGIFDVNVICHLESTKRNTLVPPWLTGNAAKTLITIVEEHQPWGG